MPRKFTAAALAMACLVAFGAGESLRAESSVKTSKTHVNKKKPGGPGQSAKTTPVNSNASTSYDRAGTDYGYK
jgi:hypothetical protein